MRRVLHAVGTVLKTLAIAVIVILVLGAAALLIITQTDFGHERVRRFAVTGINDVTHGIAHIGAVSGNLLTGFTLSDVTITDSAGEPFVSVDTVTTRYDLRALLSQRIVLTDLTLLRPVVVLDKPPGGTWNWERILFPPKPPHPPSLGWGSWIAMHDVHIASGTVIARSPWRPPTAQAAVRDSVIRAALAGDTRLHVTAAPGGYQKVMQFDSLDAFLPYIRLADPDSTIKLIQAERLSMLAEPFSPPAASITNLTATFRIDKDSLWWRDGHVTLPDSRITLSGAYQLASGDYRLRGRAAPAALADMRWIYPRLPSQGSGSAEFAVASHGDTSSVYTARNADFAIGSSTIAGDIGVSMDDTTSFSDTRLRFAQVDTRLLEQVVPGLDVPRGTFTGRVAVTGTVADMQVDADVAFDGVRTGRSRVIAQGEVGLGERFHAKDLRLRLAPVQVALARVARPTLPLAGAFRGTARLDGSLKTGLNVQMDLALNDQGVISRLVGGGDVALDGRRPRVNATVRVEPLALATARRVAPGIGLHGTARGTIHAEGTPHDVRIHADLRLPEGGRFLTQGTVDLASAVPRYDVMARLQGVKPRTVLSVGPPATLTALATARGAGLSPATMRAAIAIDVSASEMDSVPFDSVHARLTIADGMMHVDSALARTSFAQAWVHGTFGLAAAHDGALGYRLRVDSLAALQQLFPPPTDTSKVAPRPHRVEVALARARADSARIAKATEVERAAIGAPPPRLMVKPVPALSRAEVAGSLYTAGTVRGNITNFDVRGRLALANVLARGDFVRGGKVEYALVDARTPRMAVVAAATFDSVQAGGFALDSVTARVAYRQPNGTVDLAVYQDSARDYRAVAQFVLRLDHQNEVRFSQMAFRFDTTRWTAPHPSAVAWGPRGIAVDSVELLNDKGGHIFMDGRLLPDGASRLDVDIRGLQIADVAALLQSNVPADGILQLAAQMRGTERSPTFRGAAAVTRAAYGGVRAPDLRATFEYADTQLTTHTEVLSREGRRLAVANGEIPVNLSLAGSPASRLPNEPLAVDVRAEALPLQALSHVVPQVSDVRGVAIAAVSVRGTAAHPKVTGAIGVDGGAVRLVPLGVTLRDMVATLHMQGDTLVIDSLVGRTVGPVRLAGTIGIARPSHPSFGLRLTAQGATLLDNEDGRVMIDADIAMRGPFDSVAITGRTRILSGVYYLPTPAASSLVSLTDSSVFQVIDTSVVAVRDILPRESPLLKNLQANVTLAVSRDTWVRTPEANVEIYSTDPLTIQLDRRHQRLTVAGVVNTDRGDYTFLGSRFVLTRGTATFIGDPEINPILQINGQRDVQLGGRGPQAINVVIGGTLQNLRVSLSSDAQPPIPQEELLSYLAFGRSTSSLLQVEGSTTLSGQRAASGKIVGQVAAVATQQLAAIALGTLTDQFEKSAARSLGADVLNITPADIPTEVSLHGVGGLLRGTAVEAGKYVGPRTFIGVQFRPTVAPPGAGVQYHFSGQLQLQSSFESRYLLQEPTFSTSQTPLVTSVFGTFLIGDWRF